MNKEQTQWLAEQEFIYDWVMICDPVVLKLLWWIKPSAERLMKLMLLVCPQ